MVAVDPTYPLYPIACILSAAMLLLVLLTSFIRKSWNLGVAFLCFWLFLENLMTGVNAIIWADNADIKLYVYCDIYSRLEIITAVVKPMSTLIITRRLYLISSFQTVEYPSQASRRRNLAIEWTLGLGIPVIVAGPLFYIVQWLRFEVDEGFGCSNSADDSILSILILNSWNVVIPLVSILVYYPRVARIFYRQGRDINRFLQSNNSVSRTNYYRILALASVDILLTFPIGITTIVLTVTESLSLGGLPFYRGWTFDHMEPDWEPQALTYAALVASGTPTVAERYFTYWTSPVLAFAIFCLFGVTSEARASYWHIISAVGGWFGWKPTLRGGRARSSLVDIEFGKRSAQTMSLGLESQSSYVDKNRCAQEPTAEREDGHASLGIQSVSKEPIVIVEARSPGSAVKGERVAELHKFTQERAVNTSTNEDGSVSLTVS